MTQADWESVEEEVSEVLDNWGLSSSIEDAENLTMRFVSVLRKKFVEAQEDDGDGED